MLCLNSKVNINFLNFGLDFMRFFSRLCVEINRSKRDFQTTNFFQCLLFFIYFVFNFSNQ